MYFHPQEDQMSIRASDDLGNGKARMLMTYRFILQNYMSPFSSCSLDGWIVCEEFEDTLMAAWEEDQLIQAQKEAEVGDQFIMAQKEAEVGGQLTQFAAHNNVSRVLIIVRWLQMLRGAWQYLQPSISQRWRSLT